MADDAKVGPDGGLVGPDGGLVGPAVSGGGITGSGRLALVDGVSILLLDGTTDGLLLESGEGIDVTFGLIQPSFFADSPVWDGPVIGGIDDVTLLAKLGDINTINTTFFPIVAMLGSPNNIINATLGGLDDVLLVAVVNIRPGSGVYKINLGRTNDRYYTNVLTGAATNVKIPNPIAQTALIHNEDESIIHISSYKLRGSGSAILKSTLYTLNSVRNQALANQTISAGMNREPTLLANFSSNRIMLRITTENIDETFDISRLIFYLKNLWTQRPQ